MASTTTIQDTMNVASLFLRSRPLSSVGGTANEPALTIANNVMSIILGAPLVWPWNSASTTTALTVGVQNVTLALPSYGFLSTASISYNGSSYALEIKNALSTEVLQQRPVYISAHLEDGAGNVTFRLFPVPDQPYTLSLTYQQVPILATALTATWAPIPDALGPLVNLGFRAFCYEYAEDPRWVNTLQLFLSQLVGANGGLTEMQKDLFLWDRLRDARESAAVSAQVVRTTRR
jgi:hypothetical protein